MNRIEQIVESLLSEAKAGTVEVFRTILVHRITREDEKKSTKPGFNPYALAIIFQSLKDNLDPKIQKYLQRDDPEAINAFLSGLEDAFIRGGRIGQAISERPFVMKAARDVEKMAINWRDNHVLPKL